MQICVYGASSDKIDPAYLQAGERLGRQMAARGHGLIFGGGAHGMMGAVARGVLAHHGQIVGVAPSFFHVDGVLFDQCTRLVETETMRERKQIMEELADGFVMTPGGIGTFEEFFEILTLKQLGRHQKPIAVLNTGGYYDPMNDLLESAIAQQFMQPACRELYRFFTEETALLEYLEQASAAHQEPVNVARYKELGQERCGF